MEGMLKRASRMRGFCGTRQMKRKLFCRARRIYQRGDGKGAFMSARLNLSIFRREIFNKEEEQDGV